MVILYRVIKNGVAHTEKCSCHRFNETNEYFMNVSFSYTNMKINIDNFKIFVLVPFCTFTSNPRNKWPIDHRTQLSKRV